MYNTVVFLENDRLMNRKLIVNKMEIILEKENEQNHKRKKQINWFLSSLFPRIINLFIPLFTKCRIPLVHVL